MNLERVRAAAERVARSEGLEIVDVEWKVGKQRFLRVYIDRVPQLSPALNGMAAAETAGANIPLGDPDPKISHADCERMSQQLSVILDVEELLRRAAEQTKRVIDYQILSIMLYDEEQKVFRHRVDVKHGQRVQGKLRVAASEGIVGAAATLKEPVIVPDVSVDSRYLMVNPETRSELAIPMIHKGKVIGVLDLESPQLNYFTEDHVQTLAILAANLAVSIAQSGKQALVG